MPSTKARKALKVAPPKRVSPRIASASLDQPAPAARGLLGLQGVSRDRIVALLRGAEAMERLGEKARSRLAGRTVATIFFEDSTRTKTSFTLAARRLGAEVIDLPASTSSVNKGETLIDTARTIEAMGVHAMVVRARQSGAAAMIQHAVRIPIINAGDGRHEHPTQGLLDAFTISRAHARPDFNLRGLVVAIVGDVASSRVARSNIACLNTLGAKTVCVGPPTMVPRSLESLGTTVSNDLDAVLPVADVVMTLRIQFERHTEPAAAPTKSVSAAALLPSVREYRALYAMTRERAERLKPRAIVMHPGPMNRGIEIDAEVADGPRSMVTTQVANGVLVRMAVLDSVVASRN